MIGKYNENNNLIAVSIINKNCIFMLCVKNEYRNNGIGSELLNSSEKHIKENGYNKVVLGLVLNI